MKPDLAVYQLPSDSIYIAHGEKVLSGDCFDVYLLVAAEDSILNESKLHD